MKLNQLFSAVVAGATKYFKSSGDGTQADPYIPHHVMVGAEGFPAFISGFGELLTAVQVDDISVRFGANMPSLSPRGRVLASGAGSVTYSDGGYAVLDSTGGTATLTSVATVQYRNGHVNIYKMTASNTAGTGSYEAGPHDAEEGFFVTVSGGVITSATIRTDSVDTATLAANFNGDSLTGINFDKYSIFIFAYGWLGVYPPTIWTMKNQRWLKIHTFPSDDDRTTPHVRNSALPVRISAKSGAIVRTSSWNGGSIGGADNAADNPLWYSRFTTGLTTGELVIANFRVKAADANSDKVRIRAALHTLETFVQANNTGQSGTVRFRLYGNSVVGGSPSWAAVRADSLVEVDTAGTLTSGTVIWSTVAGFSDTNQGGANPSDRTVDANKLGAAGYAGDYFTLTVERISGSGTYDYNLELGWTE